MAVDLSKLSTEDLVALKGGDLSKVSTEGLLLLKGTTAPAPSQNPLVNAAAGLSSVAQQTRSVPLAFNAAMKAAAGLPDMFANAPANVANLGSAGIGTAAGELGRPDITAGMPIWEPPSPVTSMFQKPVLEVGGKEVLGPLIRPSREPQTGGERIFDLAIQGGVSALVAPGNLVGNLATGATSGAVAGGVKELTGSNLAALAAGIATPLGIRAMTNVGRSVPTAPATQERTLAEGRAAGYVIPPSATRDSMVSRRLESVGGKDATKFEADLRNQTVTNTLAKKAVGLPEDADLSVSTLDGVRQQANKAYEAIAKLSPIADKALEQLRKSRHEMSRWFTFWKRSGDPTAEDKALHFQRRSELLEKTLERQAKKIGQPELIQEFHDARTLIAKTWDVQRALNEGNGNVSAGTIGRMLGKRPLSGELSVIARFAKAFPRYTVEASRVPVPGVSAVDTMASVLLGMEGYGIAGPKGMMAAGLPLVRGPVRSGLLSERYQSQVLTPMAPLERAAAQSSLVGRQLAEER